jgi:7,8-dihydroneopterin aldolase/epimerase/oxygenase
MLLFSCPRTRINRIVQSKIFLKDLQLQTVIGLHAWELKKPQTLHTNIEISLDITTAANSDNIEDSLNYETLANNLVIWATKQNYTLLESFGMGMIKVIKEFNPEKITEVKVRIEKVGVVKNTQSCGIEIIA